MKPNLTTKLQLKLIVDMTLTITKVLIENCKPESIITDPSNDAAKAKPLNIESNYDRDDRIEASEIEV